MNKRQQKLISALKACQTYIYQKENISAAWYIWHPKYYAVRLKLTCRDIWDLVNKGIITEANFLGQRQLLKDA